MSFYREWPPYCRWRLFDQDVIADVESIRREIQLLKTAVPDVPKEFIQEWEAAIDVCAAEVRRHFFFTNRILIRQTLAEVRQELVFFAPRNNLDSVWMALKNKLDSVAGEGEIDQAKKQDQVKPRINVDEINDFFASKRSAASTASKEFELRVRRHMRAVRKHLDDRLLTDLWAAYSLQRSAKILVMQLAALVTAILAFLFKNHPCSTDPVITCWSTPDAIQMSLFGALGGTISAIARPMPGKNNETLNLPLTRFSFMRPLLGGVSGLVLFLLLASGIINLKLPYLGACALALAFGFSEKALISVLSTAANKLNSDITRSFGQGEKATATATALTTAMTTENDERANRATRPKRRKTKPKGKK